jgi:hypothetical protein
MQISPWVFAINYWNWTEAWNIFFWRFRSEVGRSKGNFDRSFDYFLAFLRGDCVVWIDEVWRFHWKLILWKFQVELKWEWHQNFARTVNQLKFLVEFLHWISLATSFPLNSLLQARLKNARNSSIFTWRQQKYSKNIAVLSSLRKYFCVAKNLLQ